MVWLWRWCSADAAASLVIAPLASGWVFYGSVSASAASTVVLQTNAIVSTAASFAAPTLLSIAGGCRSLSFARDRFGGN